MERVCVRMWVGEERERERAFRFLIGRLKSEVEIDRWSHQWRRAAGKWGQ